MSVQLARYLKDFGAPPRAAASFLKPPAFPADDMAAGADDAPAMAPAAPPVDVEAERAEAFAEGRAAAEAELQARHEAELAERAEAHAAELAALSARYEADYAAALAGRFATMAAEAADRVAADVAPVLAPLLGEALTARAIEDLARMVAEGLQAGEGLTITVKGPENLFEKLKSHFAEPAPVFRHVEMQDVDLTVEFGETVLVTRMAAWADTVGKVLA